MRRRRRKRRKKERQRRSEEPKRKRKQTRKRHKKEGTRVNLSQQNLTCLKPHPLKYQQKVNPLKYQQKTHPLKYPLKTHPLKYQQKTNPLKGLVGMYRVNRLRMEETMREELVVLHRLRPFPQTTRTTEETMTKWGRR